MGTYWRPPAGKPKSKYHCWEQVASGFKSLCGKTAKADGLETNVPFTVSIDDRCKTCHKKKEEQS